MYANQSRTILRRSLDVSPTQSAHIEDQKNFRAVRRFPLILPAALLVLLSTGNPSAAQSGFDYRVTVGIEAERKICSNCDADESDNEVETTPLELVLQPKQRPELSFGIEFEYDVDSEGDFFGSGQSDVEDESTVSVWARRQLNEVFWARVQSAWTFSKDEEYMDLGGRVGFGIDLENDRELSGYLNIDRRTKMGSNSQADEGTFVEARVEYEWEWDDYGASVELRGDRWFYDGDARDEARMGIQPGFSFELGDTPHTGLAWVEVEQRTRQGPENFRRSSRLVGLGAEFDLGKRRELLVGATIGRERERETGSATQISRVRGLIFEYQTRF